MLTKVDVTLKPKENVDIDNILLQLERIFGFQENNNGHVIDIEHVQIETYFLTNEHIKKICSLTNIGDQKVGVINKWNILVIFKIL